MISIQFYPDKYIHIHVDSRSEKLARSAFHQALVELPEFLIDVKNYELIVPDDLFSKLEQQEKEFDELVKQNPNTRIINKSG